jgi:hypothetical protein
MVTGERLNHYGFQVRVRSNNHSSGWQKVIGIHRELSEGVNGNYVTIGGHTYLVSAVSVSGPVIRGTEGGTSKRSLFLLNGKMALTTIS